MILQEAAVRSIIISDVQPACVHAMVAYMYKLEYDTEHYEGHNTSVLSFHVNMCILADAYGIEHLKKLAATKFQAATAGEETTHRFAEAAAIAYATPEATRAIREIIVDVTTSSAFIKDGEPATTMDELMRTYPALAIDMTRALQKRNAAVKHCKCPYCGISFSSDVPSRYPNMLCSCMWCGKFYYGWRYEFVEEGGEA